MQSSNTQSSPQANSGQLPTLTPISSRWDAIPFAPDTCPFFYGWVIAAVSIFCLLMSIPGQTMGVSVFTDPLLATLKINRIQLSASYMIGTIVSALVLPKAGRVYDHLGARIMTPIAAVGLGITLLVISEISAVVDLLKVFYPTAGVLISMTAICICFSFLRFFAQGMLTMLPRNMSMKWFVRRRGLINGFFGISVAVGFSSLTYLLNLLVQAYGFELTLKYVAGFVGIGFALVAALLFRDSPQASGLVPDGREIADSADVKTHSGVLLDGASLSQARGYFEFWIYCIAPAFGALSITAVSFHIVSIFEHSGYSREIAVGIYIPAAIISAVLTLLLSWLSDRMRLATILRIYSFSLILFFAGLMNLESSIGYWVLAIGMAISQSSFGFLLGLSWPRLFGVLHLGELSGFGLSVMVIGSAVGPLIFGLSFHFSASYYLAEAGCLLAAVCLFICSFRAKY